MASSAKDGMTGEILGQFIGLERSRMNELAGKGILVKVAPNRYDAAKSILQYCNHLREQAAGRLADDGINPITEGALLKRAQRIQVEEKTRILKGEVVDASHVEGGYEDIVLATRAGIMGIPQTAAVELGLDRKQTDGLDVIIREALDKIADAGAEMERNAILNSMKDELNSEEEIEQEEQEKETPEEEEE